MRSLAGFPVRRPGAGVALFVALIAAGPTGCEWLKGRPDVDHVDVSVQPTVIAEGQNATANGVPKKDDGTAISSSKVRVTYSTSDAAVATVNSQTGTVTGVAPGKAQIIATSQNKSGSATIEVVFADAATILLTPNTQLQVTVGESKTLTLDPKNNAGLSLPGRTATFTSSDTRIASVTSTGALTARVTGVALGTASITGTIGTKSVSLPVIVRTPPVARVDLKLLTGKTEMQVGESIQAVATLFDSTNASLATFGHTLSFQSSDLTVATVNSQTGVVTAGKAGVVEITVNVDNDKIGRLPLRVIEKVVKDLKFAVPSFTFRLGGGPRNLGATPLDSAGRPVDRPVTYRSTNEAVATVNTSGLITPRGLGTTQIIATIDNLTDTMTVQVTPVPITSIRVDPTQATANVGETRQFTATLFDSLGVQVTGRQIAWQTNNPTVATVSSTGLATARAPGVAQVQAFTDVVPGFAARIGQAAELIVGATPIARVQVVPDSVNVRVGQRSTVVIRAFDAAGNELFNRSASVVVRSANPGVALGDNTGAVVGVAEGKTVLTYQAVDAATGLAQGTPATIIVVVTGSGGDDD